MSGSARFDTNSSTHEEIALRPASVVLSRTRAGSVYPSPLNFSRSLVRKMLDQRWRVHKLRVDLDEAGRGEAHFRVEAGTHVFDFLAISNVFPQSQKVDRSFGVNWDISAAICEGEWSAEREAELRINIPLQRAGRFDHGVLAFARGNRSERMFDHVVDALAGGHQPDATELAGVGYVFRTTGFHSNGAVGMRPYCGIPDAHPLRPPYHAQILLALLMRDFVFDLVDHLAHVKGGDAAASLDIDLKRYLGIGNSAGLGLIPYLSNHALLIQQWALTSERARVEMLAQIPAGGSTSREFFDLLRRAVAYFGEDPRDGNGIFAPCSLIADDLRKAVLIVERRLAAADGQSWAELLPGPEDGCHAEVTEILESVLLECYPDIVSRHEGRFECVELVEMAPDMSLSTLGAHLDAAYGWLLASPRPAHVEGHYFWYAPQEAPNEPRKGRRGIVPSVELETRMDAPLRAIQLAWKLAAEDGSRPVAEFLAENPEFRGFVGHLQSVDACGYAVVQDNTLAEDFIPFPSMRFVLAYYGMEKLDPRLPRSVKGAFLQGAPLLKDIAEGRDGTWPFPLLPRISQESADTKRTVPSVPLRLVETPEADASELVRQQQIIEAASETCRMSSSEIFRTAVKALQVEGLDLGTAEFAASLVTKCQAIGLDGVGVLTGLIENELAGAHGPLPWEKRLDGYVLRPETDRPLAIAPVLFDLAGLATRRVGDGRGWAMAEGVSGGDLLVALASIAAEKYGNALLIWKTVTGERWGAIASQLATDFGIISGKISDPEPLAASMGLVLSTSVPGDHAVALACGAGILPWSSVEAVQSHFQHVMLAFSREQMASEEMEFHRHGAAVESGLARRFLALGRRALVSPDIEQAIR